MTTIKEIDGIPVIDAKKSIQLEINERDVKFADKKEPADCAAARACRRSLHAIEARIHLGRVYIRMNKGNWNRYITSRPLRAEIIAFDRGGAFEPGEYSLLAPGPNKKLTGKRKGGIKPFIRGASNKKRRKPHVVTNVRNGPA